MTSRTPLAPSLALVGLLALAPVAAFADTRADARRYFQQGMALIDQGKQREGIEYLKKAYALRPHPSVLFNIGRAYAAAGAVDPAIDFFERYLEADPTDSDRVSATLRDLKERRKLRSLVDEGMTAIERGRYVEGIALLQRAYDNRPHPNILFNIARAYEDAHDYRRAITAYERYLRTSPQDSEDVQSKLKRLRALTAKKPAPKVAQKEREPEEQPRAQKGRRTPKPAEPLEPPAERTAPQMLDDAHMERLAQMIASMVKKEGGAAAPESAPRGGGPVAESDVKEGRSAEDETSGVAGGSRAPELVAGAKSSSAAVAGAVDLEAKTDVGYEEVVVTASRREQSPLEAPNAVTLITEEDIRLSGAQSIPDLLRRVPGMDVIAMSYSDYNVSMRGLNRRIANKILVLIDGRTVYEDFLGGMLWKGLTIDLLDIARIEVVRGPGSAIYGAYAYTGMVNIITKRPEEVGGSIAKASAGNGNTVLASYGYGGRRGPIGVRASAGYERANKYELEFDPRRVDFTTSVGDPNRSLEQVRADGSAEYNFKGSGGRLFAGGGVRSGFLELYGVAALRNQAVDGRSYNVRGGYESELFSVLGFWNALRTVSAPQFYRTGESELGSKVKADIISVEPVFRPTLALLGEHALVLGGEYRHKFIEWDYLDRSHEEDHFALFAQDSWTISPSFSTIASGRLDLHPIIGALASPRIAFIYHPTRNQAIRASFGTAFRQPTQAETYLNLSGNSPVAGVAVTLVGGHDALKPENIATVDLGYLVQPDFGEFEAVVYMNRIGNLITRTKLDPGPVDGSFQPGVGAYVGGISRYVNDPRHLIAIGTELSARVFPVEGVDLGVSYAFQYIFDQESGDRFTDSPLHKVTLWGQLRTRLGLDFGLSGHLVSDQKWVEPNYDPTAATGFDVKPLPVPASIVVIGRMGYRLFEDKMELAISGVNLTDFGARRHREHPFANRVEARVLGSLTARF